MMNKNGNYYSHGNHKSHGNYNSQGNYYSHGNYCSHGNYNSQKNGSNWEKTPVEDASHIKNMWKDMPQEAVDYLKSLPEFDAEIFKEITGIDVQEDNCNGKIVEIDGKKYKLQELGE